MKHVSRDISRMSIHLGLTPKLAECGSILDDLTTVLTVSYENRQRLYGVFLRTYYFSFIEECRGNKIALSEALQHPKSSYRIALKQHRALSENDVHEFYLNIKQRRFIANILNHMKENIIEE